MKSFSRGAVVIACLFFTSGLFAQSPSFFPLEQVKPGLKGYGKTIFEGNKVERFDFEVLGVLKNVGPEAGHDSRPTVRRQSGSNGRVCGNEREPGIHRRQARRRRSRRIPFFQRADCGHYPIQQMVDIFKERPASSAPPSTVKADPRQWLKPGGIGSAASARPGGFCHRRQPAEHVKLAPNCDPPQFGGVFPGGHCPVHASASRSRL